MAVTVKAYLYQGKIGQSETEIRRFPWETTSTFPALQGKVAQVFPSLQQPNVKFTLYWKDDEGDHIAFSSEEEMREAMRTAQNSIFKVFIHAPKKCGHKGPNAGKESASKESASSPEEPKEDSDDGPQHPHIICDGCEGPVKGVRFKCTVCPDYDLCRKCKRQGKHQEHPMTAIRKPMAHPWAGFFINGRPQFGPGGPGGCGVPRFGPGGPGGCGVPPFCPPPPPCGPEGAGAGCHGPQMPGGFSGPPPNFHGPWGRFFRRQMRRFWREQGKQQEKGEGKPDDKESNEEDEEEGADKDYTTPEEYLQNVGEQVAAMLDPLGIDVQVDVEHATAKTTTCGRKGKCRRGNPANTAQGGASSSNSDENEWTLVTPDKAAPSDDEDEPPSHNGIPLLEPKIAHALNQMKAMGFSDDGGWLSRLLIAKEGDIGQVLDALKPSFTAGQCAPGDHMA